MELGGRRVIVVGLGKSGKAAVRLCHDRGAQVIATDCRSDVPVDDLPDVRLDLGGHQDVPWSEVDLIVVSPGVPPLPVLTQAERTGVTVIGELELACRFASAPVVAVGGTNGKSTTTTLLECLLAEAGRVFAGGNLGEPPSSAVGEAWDYWVLEVSSFQLERAPNFHPRASVLLNISEDHLDRYDSFEAYAHAKGNALANLTRADLAVVPHGDERCAAQATRGKGRIATFGAGGDYAMMGSDLVETRSGDRLDIARTGLHGLHNQLNLAAAVAVARDLGVDWAAIERGLGRFSPLPHRMQLVRTHQGVAYYDDSKATNVGAAVTALAGMSEQQCVLIAGGRDKHGSYAPLVEALSQRGRALVLLGEAAPRLAVAADGVLPVHHASSMQQAVELSAAAAQPGDAVLLSPACSSFDMFTSYAHRGEAFASAVQQLQ